MEMKPGLLRCTIAHKCGDEVHENNSKIFTNKTSIFRKNSDKLICLQSLSVHKYIVVRPHIPQT